MASIRDLLDHAAYGTRTFCTIMYSIEPDSVVTTSEQLDT